MKLKLYPARLQGAITPPPSKSQGHRLLIASFLAGGDGNVPGISDSEDMRATIRTMTALMKPDNRDVLHCGESGSTLRFLIPIALAHKGEGRFTGGGKLMERPQKPYFDMFEKQGIACALDDGVLTVRGRLQAGVFELAGNVSSQFVTGLLYALPLLDGESEIRLTSPLESKGYVDMTLEALAQHGIAVEEMADGYRVSGGQTYKPCDAAVEADYSQAGFFYAAEAIGNAVAVTGMNPSSRQGDRMIVDYTKRLKGSGEVVLDVSQCPDLVPPLALMAALRAGERTVIANAARLRIKESDRLATVTSELRKLGAVIEEHPEELIITGVGGFHGAAVCGHNDHRIAMMLAIAASRASEPLELAEAEAVNKSYPNFWVDYVRLGGKIEEM
jgi:5-enolpyruvylshikimate-3-phosphate synthase